MHDMEADTEYIRMFYLTDTVLAAISVDIPVTFILGRCLLCLVTVGDLRLDG